MLKDDYVTFKQAMSLKELGFPQDTSLTDYGWSCWGGSDRENIKVYQVKECDLTCIAPTLSMVQKWLWETYFLWVEVVRIHHHEFRYKITNKWSKDISFYNNSGVFDSNEPNEALSNGIDKAITILLKK